MNIYEYIDYTLLKPTATYNDIWNLCEEAKKKNCATVCIPPHFVDFVYKLQPTVQICTVIGFPFGNTTLKSKIAEAKQAITDGAHEIDVVINISELKNGNYPYIINEINEIVKVVPTTVIVKIIIETCYLTNEEIAIVAKIIDESDADYVKTSTGYGTRGASFEDIEIINSVISNRTLIKASGGIHSEEEIIKYIELGCNRIGASKLP